MLSPESATFLSNCMFELEEHTQGMIPRPVDLSGYDVEAGVLHVHDESLALLWNGARHIPVAAPSAEITRKTIELADHPNGIPPIEELSDQDRTSLRKEDPTSESLHFETPLDAIACLEAEPRLARSLAKRYTGQSERYPACILYDAAGEPFAYQKGNGMPLAFTWRDGYIGTSGGPRWVPRDSIIRTLYEPGHDPRDAYAGETLLAIKNPRIQAAHFLRFTAASWLPATLALEAAESGCERVKSLGTVDAQIATLLTGQRLGERVLPLLGWAKFIDR
jgi:hypothetical protein